jgi:hypothetical protein
MTSNMPIRPLCALLVQLLLAVAATEGSQVAGEFGGCSCWQALAAGLRRA